MKDFQKLSDYPYKHAKITERIIGCFYTVYNTLGYGFLEKVYENSLTIELIKAGFQVHQQKSISVWYGDEIVGEYFTDLIVDDFINIEIKSVKKIGQEHEAQLLNYLKATPYEVGLLLNFGPKPEHKRRAIENNRKEWFLKLQADTK